MNRAFEFLGQHKDVAFATVNGNKPEIRVFQIMKMDERTLWFATAPFKKVWHQLQTNPNIEILGMAGNISVRISGTAVFDVPDEICREIYANNPVLPRLYKAYTDLVYFRLPIKTLDFFDLTTTPPIQNHKDV